RAAKGRNLAALPALAFTQLMAQGFIRKRSRSRWLAHQLVFWGCILAALVTFPLTLGLLHFESVGQEAARYQVFVAQVGTVRFDAESIVGWLFFHALDIAAVLVLAGVFIFLRRRLHDPGALAVERSNDFLALAGLFAVSVTGLFLTVSSTWLDGRFYSALNTVHALTVILGLMYLPFGKLFHIFQRPGNLGVAYYRQADADGPAATCRRCGEAFAGAQQVADLQAVLPQVGFDYGIDGGGNYQDTCPRCRRAGVTLAQSTRVGGFG
ncbi:MAG: MFS transporter, partial [Acidimicrobiales bacterium]